MAGLVLVASLGCNGDENIATGSAGGSEGSGGDSSSGAEEDLAELCPSTLDPATFTAPVWSPPPFEATPECPAFDGPIVVELSTVTVEGTVRIAGLPTGVSFVRLVGRGEEGEAGILVEEDGTFSAPVLAGQYDVWVSSAPGALIAVERLVIEGLDLSQAADPLLIDVPPLVTLQGLMTLDGEPAPDPTAHLFIEELDGGGSLLARMDDGTYSAQLAPGAYRVFYSSCQPDWESMLHVGENPCYDPEVVLSPPFDSPNQEGILVTEDVAVEADLQLDVDVPTVRITGSVNVTDLPDDEYVSLFLRTESGGGGRIEPMDAFDERVVAGTYRLNVSGGAPLVEQLDLFEDTQIDESIQALRVGFVLAPDRPAIDVPYDAGPRVVIWSVDNEATWDEHLPLMGSLPLLPNDYRISHLTKYCWPDLAGEPPYVTLQTHQALTVDGSMEVELPTPDLARIEVDYAELAPRPDVRFEMPRVEELSKIEFYPDEPSFVAHGIVPAGSYTLRGEPIDVVDGMRIRLVEESREVDFELIVDGVPHEATNRIWIDAGSAIRVGDWIRPGRYDIHIGGHDDGLPLNAQAVVGCVTVEG